MHPSTKTGRNPKTKVVQQPTPPSQDEDNALPHFEEEGGMEMEKDERERELERLVFGDSAGFREGIQSFQRERNAEGTDIDVDAPEKEDEEGGLEGVNDADVCSKSHQCVKQSADHCLAVLLGCWSFGSTGSRCTALARRWHCRG